MSDLANVALLLLLTTIVRAGPLVLAALGGFTSERGGVMNIALEGKMLISACVTALCAVHFENAYLGLLCGIGAAVLLSLLHWLLTQKYRIDHIISGMAINAIALGASNFLNQKFADTERKGEIPLLPTWSIAGGSLKLSIYLLIAFGLPFLLWLYMRRTRGGLRLFAVGSDPDKAREMGLQPVRVRLWALLATGVFAGLAGAMIVSNSGRFSDNMTAGRGYIALAALIIGGWRPIPALLACLAFGFFEAVQLQLQGTSLLGAKIPSEAWSSLPYLATVIALAGFMGRSRAPAGLGRP